VGFGTLSFFRLVCLRHGAFIPRRKNTSTCHGEKNEVKKFTPRNEVYTLGQGGKANFFKKFNTRTHFRLYFPLTFIPPQDKLVGESTSGQSKTLSTGYPQEVHSSIFLEFCAR
jgi:hypothetical protein